MTKKMKDSGVEWIGEIPEDWRVSQLKKHVLVNNGKEIDVELGPGDEGAIPVYGSGGVFKYTNRPMFSGEAVMFGRKGTLGAPLYVKTAFWSVDTMYYLTFSDTLVARFNYYQMLVFDWAPLITHTALPSIVASKVVACKFAFPSVAEQQHIADFLDTRTSAIDASIAKTQESIEEYKKLKQAVITQAVTKGIRPGRVMKDSGVEWIGDIPEEWGCIKVKYVTSKIGSGKTPSGGATTYLSEGVRFLRSQNIYNEGLVSEGLAYISAATDEEMKSTRVLFNDVLLNITGGSIGRCCTYPDDTPANVNQHVCIIRCVDSKCIAKFMQYCWNSDIGQLSIKLLQNSANREGMSGENISNTFITYPALPEQQEIAAYLDEKCAAIDTLIEKKQAIITELEAYKKSLIYEYVTGKKEVPMASC